MLIGRGADCNWRLTGDKGISSKHCSIEFRGKQWLVRDLSTNGTFVNEAEECIGRNREQSLVDGDRLQLGEYQIGIRIAPARATVAPSALPPIYGLEPPAPAPGPWDRDIKGLETGAIDEPWNQRAAPVLDRNWKPDFGLHPAPDPAPAAEPAPVPKQIQPAVSPAAAPTRAGTPSDLSHLSAGLNLPADWTLRAERDAEQVLRSTGQLLRLAIAGIRSLLIARERFKSGFRIEHTILRPADNNPIKFAATDDGALMSLLDAKTNSLKAMGEAIDDLMVHQVATLAATQAAARALLDKLAPALVEANEADGGHFPGFREKRLWAAYKRMHADLQKTFDDDFDSAFGNAFARAYEQAANRSKS